MVTNEVNSSYKAKVDAFERNLQAKKELEDKNMNLDIAVLQVVKDVNLPFANWLVDNVERQKKAPRELLNEVLSLAMQTHQ